MASVQLSICIVNYNVREYVKKCLKSIFENSDGISLEVLLVDNNSLDNSVEMVQSEFPQVRLFPLKRNLGFAAANNIALKDVKGKFILLLNPDTLVKNNSLKELILYLEKHSNCGIVGPMLLNEDGSIQNGVRQFPRALVVFARNTFFKNFPFLKNKIDRYHMRHFDLSKSFSVDQVSGAAMMFRKETLDQIGLLDERFFIFYEEVDFCKRVKEKGLNVYYNTEAQIVHFGGKSNSQINSHARIIHMESQLKYLKKHMTSVKYYIFIKFFKLFYILTILAECLSDSVILPLYYLKKTVKPHFKSDNKYKSRLSKAHFRFFFLRKKLKHFIFKM